MDFVIVMLQNQALWHRAHNCLTVLGMSRLQCFSCGQLGVETLLWCLQGNVFPDSAADQIIMVGMNFINSKVESFNS